MLHKDEQMIGVYGRLQSVTVADQRRKVSLLIQYKSNSPDADSLWKSLLDGLVKNDYLLDDGKEWCEIGPVIFQKEKTKGIIITLEDV